MKLSIARTMTCIAIAAVVVVSTGTGAWAGNPSGTEGQGIQPLPSGYSSLAVTPEVVKAKPLTDALLAMRALYAEKIRRADGSAAQRGDDLDARIKAAEDKVVQVSGEPIEHFGVPKFASTADVSVAATPTYKYLTLTHSTQSNAYYCGPASTAMAIRASGGSEYSDYGTHPKMTQTVLANSTYLQTIAAPGGGTSMSRIPVTLSRWMGLNESLYASPSLATLRNVVLSSISGYSRALVYGTHEKSGSSNPHYNFHYTTFPIDHLITGYGYSNSGDTLSYGDPVAGWWTNTGQSEAPHNTRSMSATSMVGFVAPWGVVS